MILRTHHESGRSGNCNGNTVETSRKYEIQHEIKPEGNQTRTRKTKMLTRKGIVQSSEICVEQNAKAK